MKVLIIDYGMGNVGSVKRAIEECGVSNVIVSRNHSEFDDCTHVILPGVGAFPEAMANLEQLGLDKKIKELCSDSNVPLLGICLGMQLLATMGTEIEKKNGLNLIAGEVTMLSGSSTERIPHVGWNELHYARPKDSMLLDIPDQGDFYFVHSYHFTPVNKDCILTVTPYCGQFVSMVRLKNIIGVQFHPEKSSTLGIKMLKNFLSI